MKTLQQLAKDKMFNFPKASAVVMNNFYVDYLLSGAGPIDEAKQLVKDLNEQDERRIQLEKMVV